MSRQSIANQTFYSGSLTVRVLVLETGRSHGCLSQYVNRVEIRPRGLRNATVVVQYVCPPASMSLPVDTTRSMREAAHAALSFASDEGHPIEEYAASTDSGWHLGTTLASAWGKKSR
jgi:hypothetical protein